MEISEAHSTASKLRFPVWEKGTAGSAKVGELEDYVSVTAYWQGELAEQRLEAHTQLYDLDREWAGLEGWEAFRGGSKTDSAREDAKAKLRPDLAETVAELRWRIARLSEEIDRMEREFTKASRLYTFLTGS